MNRFLRYIGWKDYRNRLDKHEIQTDVFIILLLTVGIGALILSYMVVQNG